MLNSQEITLNVDKTSIKSFYAKQNDNNSRTIKVKLMANGVQIKPSTNEKAMFRFVKPDGKSGMNPAKIEADGSITVTLTDQVLAVSGTVYCDVSIVSGDSVISSGTFSITVDAIPVSENQLASSNEFLVLKEVTNNADKSVKEINRLLPDVKTAISNVNNAASAAKTATANANVAAEKAKETSKILDDFEKVKINSILESPEKVSADKFKIIPKENCCIKIYKSNICKVLGSFSNTVPNGTLIMADTRGIRKDHTYTLSFDTPKTDGATALVRYEEVRTTRAKLDGSRFVFVFKASSNVEKTISNFIQLEHAYPQGSGKVSNVLLVEGDSTVYEPFEGKIIEDAVKNKKYEFISAEDGNNIFCNSAGGYSGEVQIFNKDYVDERTADFIDNTVSLIGRNHADLKMVTYGDSLYASGNDSNADSWQRKVMDYFGIKNHIGVSIGGSGFFNITDRKFDLPSDFRLGENLPLDLVISHNGRTNANLCSWERISATIPEDADLIIVGTGANDIGGYSGKTPVEFLNGNRTDTAWAQSPYYSNFNGDFNLSQGYGAIMSTIMKLQCRAPKAKIIVTNWCNSRSSNFNTDSQSLPDREELTTKTLSMIDYASKLSGVTIIDLFHNSGINQWNRDRYVKDLIHLNAQGYELMANTVISGLKNILI